MTQSTFQSARPKAVAGQLGDDGPRRIDTGFPSEEIAFGRFVAWDPTVTDHTIKLPAAATDISNQGAGVAQQNVAREPNAGGWKVKEDTGVLSFGRIHVECDEAAVKGGDVYVHHAGALAGTFSASAGIDKALLPQAKFAESIAAAGVVMIGISLP